MSTTTKAPQSITARTPLDLLGAAAHLGVTERYMRRAVAERRIRHYKVGKLLRFDPADLDAFMAAGVVEAVPR